MKVKIACGIITMIVHNSKEIPFHWLGTSFEWLTVMEVPVDSCKNKEI